MDQVVQDVLEEGAEVLVLVLEGEDGQCPVEHLEDLRQILEKLFDKVGPSVTNFLTYLEKIARSCGEGVPAPDGDDLAEEDDAELELGIGLARGGARTPFFHL